MAQSGDQKQKKLTPEMITPTIRSHAEAVLLAKAMVAKVRPIVRGYQQEILARHQFRISPENENRNDPAGGDIITNPDHSWLMADADFQIFLAESNQARIAAGLKVESANFCPLLVAQHRLVEANRALVDAMEPLTNISADDLLCSPHGLENYAKYIDLTLAMITGTKPFKTPAANPKEATP